VISAVKSQREKILPVAAKYDAAEEFPWDIIKILAQSDLCGVYIPEEYGGMGGGILELCITVEELSRACAGIALAFAGTALGTDPDPPFRQRRAETKISSGYCQR
jgi:alkylation response protein AidB-like acyl-CoA dehydrogenase